MKLLLCLCLVVFVFPEYKCFVESPFPDTSPEIFPFHALVKGASTCSGILISENYVITPASCVHGAKNVSVFLGFRGYPYFLANHAEPDVQIYYSCKVMIHDDYVKIAEDRYLNNIALVELPHPAPLCKTVHPGTLISKKESKLLEGSFVNISGWMISQNTPMKLAEVQLRNQDTCDFLFGHWFFRDQERCVKWFSSIHLNLLGNPLTVNGKVIGYQTNTPVCTVKSSTCSRNDMVLSIVPFLDWISRKTDIEVSQFLEPEKGDSYYSQTLELIKEVKEIHQIDIVSLNSKIDIISNSIQKKQQQDTKYAVQLDEQTRDIRSEISNTETKQNASIVKLQEEIGDARTEITNGLSAQNLQNENLAKRIAALEISTQQEERLLKIEGILKQIEIQTEVNRLSIIELNTTILQEINILQNNISLLAIDKKHLVQELENSLAYSVHNITATMDRRIVELNGEIIQLYDTVKQYKLEGIKHNEKLEHDLLHVSTKSGNEYKKACERMDLLEAVANENRAHLDKHIAIENHHFASILEQQEHQSTKIKKCCAYSEDYVEPTIH